MNASCKIEFNALEKSFQIWNPHAKLPVHDRPLAVECMRNLALALRNGFQCSHVDGHPCTIQQHTAANLLHINAMQIASCAEENADLLDHLLGTIVRTELVQIREFKLAVCNYDLFKKHLLHQLPSEITANIFDRLDVFSYLNGKSTCHTLKKLLTTACLVQENRASNLKTLHFQALAEARKKLVREYEDNFRVERASPKVEEYAKWPDY